MKIVANVYKSRFASEKQAQRKPAREHTKLKIWTEWPVSTFLTLI